MSKVSCLGTRLLSLCLLLGTGLLPACGDEDLDGDGFTVEQGDCDDDDSAISPAAEELCDGVDNDCDGSIDVDATDASLGYADDDGDGFGDLASPMWSCEAEGVTDATDCDDADADSYPGARETCDGRDNDCDSATDEYADDAVDWYLDYDGDGYGDSEHRVVACDAPTDEYVEVGEDCDDQDPKSYPGAAELCIDGVDTDCDGLADEDDEDACPVFQGWSEQVVSLQDADVSLVGAPVSYLGRSAVAVNVDGDDLQDLLVGAVGDERVYLFLGSTLVSGAELTSDDADYVFSVTIDQSLGDRVTNAGDVDGDDLDDLLIGGWSADGYLGAAYLVLASSLASSTEIVLDTDADYRFVGSDPNGYFGYSIGASDLDGDGLSDLIIGALGANSFTGSAYVFLAAELGASPDLTAEDADVSISGVTASGYLGIGVSGLADFDGDEHGDLILGEYGNNAGGTGAGKTWLVSGADLAGAGDVIVSDVASYAIVGRPGDYSGILVGGVGDVDDDGRGDFMIGSWGGSQKYGLFLAASLGAEETLTLDDADYLFEGEEGFGWPGFSTAGDVDADGRSDLLLSSEDEAYLVLASSLGADQVLSLAELDYVFSGDYAPGAFSAGSLGDLDGDGLPEVFFGVPGSDLGAGAVHVLMADSLSSGALVDVASLRVDGLQNGGDEAGNDVAVVGDMDGDGVDDLVVGGSAFHVTSGRACLFYASTIAGVSSLSMDDADVCFEGEEPGDWAGNAVANAGDVDGDGLDDLLVGAAQNDEGGEDAGKVYLVLASSLDSKITVSLADADYSFVGEFAEDQLGTTVSGAGDVDGDGDDDLLFGAWGNDDGGQDAGKVYLVLASSLGANPEFSLQDADLVFLGTHKLNAGGYGNDLVGGGNLDGDHLSDILIGSHNGTSSDRGAAYAFLGASLFGQTERNVVADADYVFDGVVNGGDAGYGLTWVADMDQDGRDEVLVGSGGWDNNQSWLFLSSNLGAPGGLTMDDADYEITGEDASGGDRAGSILGHTDVDGDGIPDLLFGAWQGNAAGRTYLLMGSTVLAGEREIALGDADTIFEGMGEARSGYSVSGGDVNGDGLGDIFIGAPYQTSGGTAYVILSR